MYTIRNAKPADIDAIMEIERVSFDSGIVESELTYQRRIELFPQGFCLLESGESQSPIAYISSEIHHYRPRVCREQFVVGHEIGEFHDPAGSELYISSMGLLPAWRGLGLGGRLLDHLLLNLPGNFPKLLSVLLIVSQSWGAARSIYRRRGFTEIDFYAGFLQTVAAAESDVVVMRRPLPLSDS